MFRLVQGDMGDIDALWITAGGAVEPGETFEEAAVRELWEETGISNVPLGPCVWVRKHVFRWRESVYESRERFFVVHVGEVSVHCENWAEVEREFITEHRWWTIDEIAASSEVFVPRRLASLLRPIVSGVYPEEPIETGA
jgi:8-oxo-dGTP pyrophosphatase MutT (NUDIX family)